MTPVWLASVSVSGLNLQQGAASGLIWWWHRIWTSQSYEEKLPSPPKNYVQVPARSNAPCITCLAICTVCKLMKIKALGAVNLWRRKKYIYILYFYLLYLILFIDKNKTDQMRPTILFLLMNFCKLLRPFYNYSLNVNAGFISFYQSESSKKVPDPPQWFNMVWTKYQ